MARKRSSKSFAVLNCSHWTTNGCRVSFLSTAWSNSATRLALGRSPNWTIGATSPARAMSSARPSSSNRSSVAGCVVAARGSACGVLFSSKTTTGMPRRPRRQAHKSPTGPPPAIKTRRSPAAIISALLLALVVVMDLEQHTAALGLERAVIHARRAARIGRGFERLAALAGGVVADDEVAGHQVDLLPVVVHERRCSVDAGIEAQKPRAAAHLAGLVDVAGQDLLLDAGWIAGRRGPALAHVDAQEFEVGLVHRHGSLRDTAAGKAAETVAGRCSLSKPPTRLMCCRCIAQARSAVVVEVLMSSLSCRPRAGGDPYALTHRCCTAPINRMFGGYGSPPPRGRQRCSAPQPRRLVAGAC